VKTKPDKAYALDCAALMLPYTVHKKFQPPVVRVMAVLDEDIAPAIIKQAALDLAPRFPIMYARLQKGFIWNHLVGATDLDVVIDEREYPVPCRPFDYWKSEKPIFRIVYDKNELGVEFSHMSCDGFGIMAYLNSLIARCLEIKGYAIEKNRLVLDCRDAPSEEEHEDGYRKVYEQRNKSAKTKIKDDRGPAYQFPRKESRGVFSPVTVVDLPLDAVKKLTKEKYNGCTVNQYLGAVYSSAYLEQYEKDPRKHKKPLKVAFYCDLRQFWQTNTLRNFTGDARFDVAPKKPDYDFGDVLALVRREISERMTKEVQQELVINQNVRYLYLPFMKVVPGFVKKFVAGISIPIANRFFWPHTATLSNLGLLKIPPSLASHVRRYIIFEGETPTNRALCLAVGVNNVLTMTFSGVIDGSFVQDFCVDFFKKDGLPVEVAVRYGKA